MQSKNFDTLNKDNENVEDIRDRQLLFKKPDVLRDGKNFEHFLTVFLNYVKLAKMKSEDVIMVMLTFSEPQLAYKVQKLQLTDEQLCDQNLVLPLIRNVL